MKIITTITDPASPQFGQTFEVDVADPATSPLVLSKTAFQDYAISVFGSGDVIAGMNRFSEIMDATRDSTNGAVRFAYARYQAAQTFEKANVELLAGVMETGGAMTPEEKGALIENWPEG